MNFKRGRSREEPEINFIPLIDLLLVILIFLMLSTTYSRFTELQVNLPAANSEKLKDRPGEIVVAVSSDGRYSINRKLVDGLSTAARSEGVAFSADCEGGMFGFFLLDALPQNYPAVIDRKSVV